MKARIRSLTVNEWEVIGDDSKKLRAHMFVFLKKLNETMPKTYKPVPAMVRTIACFDKMRSLLEEEMFASLQTSKDGFGDVQTPTSIFYGDTNIETRKRKRKGDVE